MDAKFNKFVDSVGSFFSRGDQIPWCDHDIIQGCEREVADAAKASLSNAGSPLQQREKIYLLAVGYYRNGDFSRSRQLVEQCLEVAPDWRQAMVLKKTLEDKIAKDGIIGIGITAGAVGLVAAGLAAVLSRKK